MSAEIQKLHVHHIGYLVKSIERAIKEFIKLGYEVEQETVYDEYRNINICFLIKDGYRVELVSPLGDKSVVGDLRKKLGNSPYHICYEVQSLDESIEYFKHNKYIPCEEPHEAIAMDKRRVVFLIHGQLGMIELVQIAN